KSRNENLLLESLGMDALSLEHAGQRRLGKNIASVSQCLRRINVLPDSIADIKGTQFAVCRQDTHAIGERAVPVDRRLVQSGEEGGGTNEHSGIHGIVTGDLFSDVDDVIRNATDLRRIVHIEDAVQLAIDGKDCSIILY